MSGESLGLIELQKERGDRTEGVSFRLKKRSLDKLRNEAESREISLNTLVNQIFSQFLEWDNVAPKAKMVSLPRSVLIALSEIVTESQVKKLAEDFAKHQNRNMMLMLRDNYDIQSVLSVTESWARASGFAYRKDYSNGNMKYIINHDMGKKWSIYLGEFFDSIFEELGKKSKSQVSENLLAFSVDVE